jgi:hypothetical protein
MFRLMDEVSRCCVRDGKGSVKSNSPALAKMTDTLSRTEY